MARAWRAVAPARAMGYLAGSRSALAPMSGPPLLGTLPPGLVPTAFDLAAMAAMMGAFVVLMLAGRLLTGGRSSVPVVDFVAGWGGLSLVLTVWGVATETSMAWPALLAPLAALAALAWTKARPDRAWWRRLARTLGLGLPLIVVMAAVLPGETDTFLYWLPNAAFLHDHGMFPADDRIQHFSLYPAHTYNLQFVTYLAGLALPDFSRAAPIHFNVVLNVLFAGLLAQIVEQARGRGAEAVPGWGVLALAFLVAMPLNPGFVPEFNLSSYGESTIGIALAVAVIAALGVREAAADGRALGRDLVLLALCLAALVNIKQTSVVFVGGVGLGLAWLLWRDRMPPAPAAVLAALPILPAALEHGAWRAYVIGHFAHGENELLPRDQWHVDAIPTILFHMAKESLEKGYFTALVVVVLVLAIRARRHLPRGLVDTTLMMAAWLYGLNVLFLFTMYVIQFPGVMGPNAQSFYRYCTQNAPLFLVALAPVATALANVRPRFLAALRRAGPAFVAIWLAVPVAGIFYVRYDQRMPVPLFWRMAEVLSVPAKSGSALAIVVPTGDGQEWTEVRVALQVTSPRRADIRYTLENAADEASLARLREAGFDRVMLSCVPPGLERFGTGGAVVLAAEDGGWRPIARYDYPPMPGPGIWRAAKAEKITGCR
jgi:hypothetical protein